MSYFHGVLDVREKIDEGQELFDAAGGRFLKGLYPQPVDAHVSRPDGATFVPSISDARTVNNVMRHGYRVLHDTEKAQMTAIKDAGLAFYEMLDGIGTGRELSLAKTKIEEAVMWAVKHVTQ